MRTSISGQYGQTADASCYNCGSVGHWAVACPEPTRTTPAGLATWRNASAPGQYNPNGQTSTSNKRSKGTIVTKYPPPSTQYPPVMSHLLPPPAPPPIPPPLPPGHHHHHHHHHHHPPPPPPPLQPPPPPLPSSSYQSQHPSTYQAYAPPPPVPTYSGSFSAPSYGYLPPPPQYSPPPPHGTSQYGPPAYIPPPVSTGLDFRPPPPLPHNHAVSRPSPPPQSSPPVSSSPSKYQLGKQMNPAPAKPPSLPPKPPVGAVSHPLPPKPPKSHNQIIQQQDHRNRRKNDRQNKGRDRRQGKDHYQHQRNSNTDAHQRQHSPDNHRSTGSRKAQQQNHGSFGPLKHDSSSAGSPDQSLANPQIQGTGGMRRASNGHVSPILSAAHLEHGDVGKEFATQPLFAETVGNEPEPSSELAEQGREEIPTHPGSHNGLGFLDDSDERPKLDHQGSSIKNSSEDDNQTRRDREPKRRKTDISPRADRKRAESEEGDGCLWKTIDVPRQVDRRRQTERNRMGGRRRGTPGSRASRHSTPSTQSSDLNSLEAELLGRAVRQKSPDRPSVRHRSEHHDARIKPKRRRTNTNSAYSRRW